MQAVVDNHKVDIEENKNEKVNLEEDLKLVEEYDEMEE